MTPHQTEPFILSAIDERVGKRLRYYRIQKNLTQKDLGCMMGISYQQIQKYEIGETRLSVGRLYQCAKVLKVPASHFLEDENAEERRPHPIEMNQHTKIIALAYERIQNPEVKTKLADLILSLTRHTGKMP